MVGLFFTLLILLIATCKLFKVYRCVRTPVHVYTTYIFKQFLKRVLCHRTKAYLSIYLLQF